VRIEHLAVGDYWIDRGIVVERKSYADFALSLADGRLFPQAARLARCPHRPVVLLEGPRPLRMPQIHPHALKGAMASLAVMWRLPVLAHRLLLEFGSVERVVTADAEQLMRVRGVGRQKAERIRELVE
jgi:ERCC4-type nuclease